MGTFRDKNGREWTVAIDGYVLHRARSHGKINLSTVFEGVSRAGASGEDFSIDPVILLELCFYGCEGNARVRAGKVDKEDFLRALTGQALVDALTATAEALTECFAPPKKAEGKEADVEIPLAVIPEAPVSR